MWVHTPTWLSEDKFLAIFQRPGLSEWPAPDWFFPPAGVPTKHVCTQNVRLRQDFRSIKARDI